MRYEIKFRNNVVPINSLENVVAVKPSEHLHPKSRRAALAHRFGSLIDSGSLSDHPVEGGIDRLAFEKAQWLFVEPLEPIARAASTRSLVEDAELVRQVYSSRTGTLVGTGHVTVQIPPDVPKQEAIHQLKEDGLRLVRTLSLSPNLFEARIEQSRPELEVITDLQQKHNRYVFVEPVFIQVLNGRRTPTDPNYSAQWFHNNSGGNGGQIGADIRSEQAWNLTSGQGVRVAVIDNGIGVRHPDLRSNISSGAYFLDNPSGSASFIAWSAGQSGFPNSNHGTGCLGMVGACWNNKHGGCGSAPESDLMPIACIPDQVGSQLTLARAIEYAADPTKESSQNSERGADVISCSLGPNGAIWEMTSILELAIRFAANSGRNGNGVPIFWAVTNGPHDIADDQVCSHPDVIAVARSNRNDQEDGAGYGAKLDFLAPGCDVYLPWGNSYSIETGCSFSAPLAAGVAALVLSRYPNWNRIQVRDRLRGTCDKIGGVSYNASGHHPNYGYGRINAEQAVQ